MNMTFFVTWILWSNQIGLLNSALTSFAWYGSLSFSIPICFHKIRVTTSLHGCHCKCLVSPSMAITTSGCVKLGHCLSFFWSASRHLPCPSVRRDHQQQTKWAGSLHLWELQERPGRKSRRRYCFLVDRQCAVAKASSAYHTKVRFHIMLKKMWVAETL